MNEEQMKKLVSRLIGIQNGAESGFGLGCSPIKISIGYVSRNNQVEKGIVITECPACVISALSGDYSLSMEDGKLHVEKYR